jgi:hypothetical protein
MKTFKLVLLLAAALFAQDAAVYYNNTKPGKKTVVEVPYSFYTDVQLDSGATAYSGVIDFLKVPRLVYDTSSQLFGADTTYTNNHVGALKASCYLVDDTTDANDTLDVDVYLEFSEYAGDFHNPNSSKSDSWTADDDVIAVSGTAAQASASALREGTPVYVQLPKQYTRYGRIVFANQKVGDPTDTRCKAILEGWQVQ